MFSLKLTKIGNSLGLILPKEVLARLKLAKGDEIYITEAPQGYRITPHNPAFETQMSVSSCNPRVNPARVFEYHRPPNQIMNRALNRLSWKKAIGRR